MLFLLFCGMLFFLFSATFAAALWTNEKAEKLWLPILLANALIFYLGVSLHMMDAFFYGLYAVNMLALPITIAIKLWKNESIPWRNLTTPGIVFLTAGLFAVFWKNDHPSFYWWDVISHWGTYSKLLFFEGKLSCEYPPDILLHASYPPGQGILSVMVHKCFWGVPFQERIVLFGHDLITWGVFARLFSCCNWQNWKKIFFFEAVLLLLAYPLVICNVYTCGYCDCALALLFAVAMYDVVTTPLDQVRKFFELAVMLSFLFLIRNAGWGYAIGLLILYAIRILRNFRQATDTWGKKCAILTMFALPVIVKLSWVWQLKHYHTFLRFGGNHITWQAISDLIINKTTFFLHALGAFGLRLCMGYLEAFLVLVFLLWWVARRSRDPQKMLQAKTLIIFNSIAFALFGITLFLYYQFEFMNSYNFPCDVLNESDFPSLRRYYSSFLFPFLIVVLLFFGDATKQEKTAPAKKGKRALCLTAAVIWLTAYGSLYLGKQLTYFCFQYDNTAVWRRESEMIERFADLLLAPEVRFAILDTKSYGFKSLCFTYWAPHNHKLVGELFGKNCLNPMPTAEVQNALLKHQIHYVYAAEALPEFYQMHPELFLDQELESLEDTLFQVMPDGRLRKVSGPGRQ